MLAVSGDYSDHYISLRKERFVSGMMYSVPIIYGSSLIYVRNLILCRIVQENISNKSFLFQSLICLSLTIGLRKLPATIIKYPALLLTPVFSNWTFGCASGCSCRGRNHLKVSWWLTWGNLVITTFGVWSLFGICYANGHKFHRGYDSFFRVMTDFSPSGAGLLGIPCSTLLSLSWITLIILQILPKCHNCCCMCCQTNCFPVFQETVLDADRPLEVIEWPLKEQLNEEEQVEMLTIPPNQGEAISKVFNFQCGHRENDLLCISCRKNIQAVKRSYTF